VDQNVPLKPRNINIGGKATVLMGKGDRLLIETPGAGAWGEVQTNNTENIREEMGDFGHLKNWEARGSLTSKSQPEFGGF
jgi:5-oxoprolinase (ATP-hydrolysing)